MTCLSKCLLIEAIQDLEAMKLPTHSPSISHDRVAARTLVHLYGNTAVQGLKLPKRVSGIEFAPYIRSLGKASFALLKAGRDQQLTVYLVEHTWLESKASYWYSYMT